jgi:hypothetical protein
MGNPLRDLGLSDIAGSSSNGDHMQLEHRLLISLSSPLLEKHLVKALSSFSEMSRETSKTIKLVGYGLTAYLLLLGVSKVIHAASVSRGNNNNNTAEADENLKQ